MSRPLLELVAEGRDNRAIADRLYLSPNTVRRHMANVAAKFHLRTRVEAVLYAQRHGLLG